MFGTCNYSRIFDHETSLHTVLAANCKYMSESNYYYQKVRFFEFKNSDPIALFAMRYLFPFIIPILIFLAYLFKDGQFIISIFAVPILGLLLDLLFFNKTVDSGDIIFYKDKMKVTSNKISIEATLDRFDDIKIVINEYEGQILSMISTSRGGNNRMTFTFENIEYDFEISLNEKNIKFLYENLESWNKNFEGIISIKNYSSWRFFRFWFKLYF